MSISSLSVQTRLLKAHCQRILKDETPLKNTMLLDERAYLIDYITRASILNQTVIINRTRESPNPGKLERSIDYIEKHLTVEIAQCSYASIQFEGK